jgi:hypothetical protein
MCSGSLTPKHSPSPLRPSDGRGYRGSIKARVQYSCESPPDLLTEQSSPALRTLTRDNHAFSSAFGTRPETPELGSQTPRSQSSALGRQPMPKKRIHKPRTLVRKNTRTEAHADVRTKRARTRTEQVRQAISEERDRIDEVLNG